MKSNSDYHGAQCNPILLWLLFVCFSLTSSTNALANDLDHPQVVGHWSPGFGQFVRVLSVHDGYAYCQVSGLEKSELVIVDVHTSTAPRRFGGYVLGPDTSVGDLAFSGHFAYMTAYSKSGELTVMDVSEPANPNVITTLDISSGWRLMLSGHYLLLGELPDFDVYDLADPASPEPVGRLHLDGKPRDMAVSGNLLYVISGGVRDPGEDLYVGTTLEMIDISDPLNPSPLGSVETPEWPQRLTVSDGRAFVVVRGYVEHALSGGLQILDLSVPTSPRPVAMYEGQFSSVTVSGTLAYVANYDWFFTSYEMEILDVSEPAHPVRVGRISQCENGVAWSSACWNRYRYVGGNGLYVNDFGRPAIPQRVGTYVPTGPGTRHQVQRVAVLGNLAFLAETWEDGSDTRSGLRIVDITDPRNPQSVGLGVLEGFHEIHAVSAGTADYVFLATDWTEGQTKQHGLKIMDVRDPAEVKELGRVQAEWASDVTVSGDLAYLVGQGMDVVDLSDPTQPRKIGRYEGISATRIVVAGNRAYVSGSWEAQNPSDGVWTGLQVIDVSAPDNPRLIGSWGETNGVSVDALSVGNNYAYLFGGRASGGDQLRVIDISGSTDPQLVSTYESPGFQEPGGASLAVSGAYAYLGCWTGLTVLDISDPANLRRVGGNSALSGSVIPPSNMGWPYCSAVGGEGLFDVAAGRDALVYAAVGTDGLAILNPVGPLRYSLTQAGPSLEWDLGILQFAPTIEGPWTDLPAASPFPLSPIGDKGFFRVKVSSSARASADEEE